LPTAELIKPRSYNTAGRIWKQGEVVEVTDELARKLADNPRFRVRGSDDAPRQPVVSGKPKARDALHETIRDAADRLDPDNEAHYTVTGKPECQALSEILGYHVTATERDQAIGVIARKATVEAVETKEPRFKIKKVRLKPPASEPLVEAKEPTAAAVPAADLTTLNAIEVN
jgi:hypothetical protein